QEEGEGGGPAAGHRVGRRRGVGDSRRVTETDRRCARQAVEQRACHGEAAGAGVEDAERGRVHGRGTGTLNPTPWGTTRTFSSGGKSIRCAETKASAPEKRWLKIHSTSQSCTS